MDLEILHKTKIALLEERLAAKTKLEAELTAQVEELREFRQEAAERPGQFAELKLKREQIEDGIVKANRSISDSNNLIRSATPSPEDLKLVADAETFGRWYVSGVLEPGTQAAARRLVYK